MKPAIFLRAAAVIAFVQFVAHSAMFVLYTPKHGQLEADVVATMKAHGFDFAGSTRTYWDLYFGYGLFAALNCLIEAILFWQLASLGEGSAQRTRPVVGLFLFANIAYAILVLRYFFITPLIPDVAIAACLGLALATGRSITNKN